MMLAAIEAGTPDVSPFVIIFAACITENMVLTNFLGMCPFLNVSRELKSSSGLGLAVIFVLTFTCLLNALVYKYVLVPLEVEYLRFIVFIVVIAAFVQFVEMVIERVSPLLYMALGIFLPLITVNCAILGASLFMTIRNYTVTQSVTYGLGSGLGWTMAIIAMAGIRQKLIDSRIPKPLQGPGITLIVAGIMSLAFIGFSGMLNIR